MTISIIVPIYHGKEYIRNMVAQVMENAGDIPCDIQLLLVNDDPDVPLQGNWVSGAVHIEAVGTDRNRGIHGARVRGLERARGELILFLDQDDRIAPNYLERQIACLGQADAVVCRAVRDGRLHYTDTHVFEKVISKEFMLRKWCPIVSPGQVLLRRQAIPELWMKRILKNTGADDYFLWLLMAAEGKTFALDQDVLFEHVATGRNASSDTVRMMDSEEEMIEILREEHVFHGEEEAWLAELPKSLRKVHVQELDRRGRALAFLLHWHRVAAQGGSPLAFFERRRIRTIAIYGAGDLGNGLRLLLRGTEVRVAFYIDQNAEYIRSDIPVCRKEALWGPVDAVIMTVGDRALEKEVGVLAGCQVYRAEEIWER